jgi:hypothetical protein
MACTPCTAWVSHAAWDVDLLAGSKGADHGLGSLIMVEGAGHVDDQVGVLPRPQQPELT